MYYENKFKTNKEQDLYKAITDWENLSKGVYYKYDQIEKNIILYVTKKIIKKKLKYLDKDATTELMNYKRKMVENKCCLV